MSLVDHYLAMAHYNRWMNVRLFDLCSAFPDEERRRDRGAFFRSIHGTLNHLLVADWMWMRRFLGESLVRSVHPDGLDVDLVSVDQVLFSDFETLRRAREGTDEKIVGWIECLDGETLAAPFLYRTSRGREFEHPLWWAVSHFFNHQTHHRGQLTTLLFQAGVDPGVTDLVAVLRAPEELGR